MLGARMDAAAKRNNAAKAAIETALFDAVGKSFDLPATVLLGVAFGTPSQQFQSQDWCPDGGRRLGAPRQADGRP
jgi:L-alanine-DL-glutamate epimerase-like enolase superfamily enzyme